MADNGAGGSTPTRALRRLHLVNAHTGETFEGSYRNDKGRSIELSTNSAFFCATIIPAKDADRCGVIDFLADILDAVGETRATILSAYRTAETTRCLRARPSA